MSTIEWGPDAEKPSDGLISAAAGRDVSRPGAAPRLSVPRPRVLVPAVAATTFVLLAYMPFLGRGGALSDDASGSRVVEIAFLLAATLCAVVLRGRRRHLPTSAGAFWLAAVVATFSLWALITSLQGPLMVIGLAKAGELLALCFIAFQVTRDARAAVPTERRRIAGIALTGIVLMTGVLILSNIHLYGRLLPLENVTIVGAQQPLFSTDDWLGIDQRPRLLLGMNHPLASALVLAFGVICCIDASPPWAIKLPVLIGLSWLLHLCDARGIEAGTVLGVAFALFQKIRPSPFRGLLAILAIAAIVFVAAELVLSGDLHDLIVGFAGSDALTLNSRIPLWTYALALVPKHPLMGVGYFSTQFYLLQTFPFAGHAHNSFIEVLVSTGMIGAVLFLMFLILWVYALVRTADPLLIGISPIVAFEGSLDPILFTPGPGMFLMMLVMFNALMSRPSRAYAREGRSL